MASPSSLTGPTLPTGTPSEVEDTMTMTGGATAVGTASPLDAPGATAMPSDVSTPTSTVHNGQHWTSLYVAMTTPFSMPPDCLDFNGATMDEYSTKLGNSFIRLTYNFKLAATRSCWPSSIYDATYSPAVCPSGWSYYSIVPHDTISADPGRSTTHYPHDLDTSAYCCPSSFTMAWQTSLDYAIPNSCTRTVPESETSFTVIARADSSTVVLHGEEVTLVIPDPMTITWQAADASTLSPMPPTITDANSFIPTWTPGHAAQLYAKNPYDDSASSNRLATGVFAAVIAVPIVIFLAILGCCICCFRVRRRREKQQIAKEQEESEAATVGAEEGRTSTQDRNPIHSIDGARDQGQGNISPVGAAMSASTTAPQAGAAGQQPATEHGETTRNAATHHPLSEISKPPYPGLPSQGFDGIEEPPPYVEAAPTYPLPRRAVGEPRASRESPQNQAEPTTQPETHNGSPRT